MFDVVILTDHRYVNPEKVDWYVQQVLDENKLLQNALEKKGLKVCKQDWADSSLSGQLPNTLSFGQLGIILLGEMSFLFG
jgi:hypothetical protein